MIILRQINAHKQGIIKIMNRWIDSPAILALSILEGSETIPIIAKMAAIIGTVQSNKLNVFFITTTNAGTPSAA
jgi:hypothetical protein